jgi:hypothetical protein
MTAACARRRDHSRKSSLSIAIDKWLRRLVENRDDAALIVAMTVGSLLIEDGPHAWFKLSRIVALTGQPHAISRR